MKVQMSKVINVLLFFAFALAPYAGAETAASPVPNPSTDLTPPLGPTNLHTLLPEDNLKEELRNLHENLRRTETTLGEVEREAGRRQMVANPLSNNDTFISDPWSSCMPANQGFLRADSTRPGPYLKCRPAYLKLSLGALDSLAISTDNIIGKLADLTGGAKGGKDAAKVKVDIDVLKDTSADFKQKLSALKSLCLTDNPDNALILTAVHTLKETVDGLDAVGKRLWKS